MRKLNLSRLGVSRRWLSVPGCYLAALVRLIKIWQARSHNREFMARIDARQAQDIGLTQWEIRREIAKPFWRE